MKFDYVIGNPPYQDTSIGDNDTFMPPIYNKFLDASYEIGNKVELIHPARFLFNAGSTPKEWNERMLQDEHLKVIYYEEDSRAIFPGIITPIKGGIVITYHDKDKCYGAINIFTQYPILNKILNKVITRKDFHSFENIMTTSYAYHFTENLYLENPHAKGMLSVGHEFDLKSNVFEKLPMVFHDEKPNDGSKYISILGREENERKYKYIKASYVNEVDNLYKYKAYLSGATGQGTYGEALTMPIRSAPGIGSTETFLSIGSFDSADEVDAVIKYVQSKFARSLLGVLKKTQANTPGKWKYVPDQDFTSKSDIDWSMPVSQIDVQLYEKYKLSSEEIEFIESNVKEMN